MMWLRMRRASGAPLPSCSLPDGVKIMVVDEDLAPACRELMNEVYGASEGEVPTPFARWWQQLLADSEFDPALCRAALSGNRVIGYCHGWRSPFVKDLVVAADFRGRGLASAMLTQLLCDYDRRNAAFVDLKTNVENLTAQRLYRRFGFEEVERI
jgi:ribosomal protein S18 acetylase RimI-like enzyme